MFRLILYLSSFTLVLGCGTLSAAAPMEPGQHRVGATFGGPFTTNLGPPIPIPNLIVEARSGLEPMAGKPVDINYGVNVTAIAFGLMGVHVGGSVHLLENHNWRPGLSLTERLHLYNNYLDFSKPPETRMLWGLNEFDITASWSVGNHRLYIGGSDILDLSDPEFLIAPFAGVELTPRGDGPTFQLETRILGANFSPEIWDLTWLTVGEEPGYGLISITASASWVLGAEGE